VKDEKKILKTRGNTKAFIKEWKLKHKCTSARIRIKYKKSGYVYACMGSIKKQKKRAVDKLRREGERRMERRESLMNAKPVIKVSDRTRWIALCTTRFFISLPFSVSPFHLFFSHFLSYNFRSSRSTSLFSASPHLSSFFFLFASYVYGLCTAAG
jgi:hypothetical protein